MFGASRQSVVTLAVEQRTLQLLDKHITYTLKRSKRRSIGLRVDDRGLTVSAPLRASEKWLHSVLLEKADWVVDKLGSWQSKKVAAIVWEDGASIPFRGETFVLQLSPYARAAKAQIKNSPIRLLSELESDFSVVQQLKLFSEPSPTLIPPPLGEGLNPVLRNTSSLSQRGRAGVGEDSLKISRYRSDEPHNDVLLVPVGLDADAARIEKCVTAWYRIEALRVFEECIAHFSPPLNVMPSALKLSSARTQWGSCTTRGVVRLNWQLVKMPLHLIDYVVVHELAHLVEMNHSAAFWRVVESVCPDYKVCRKELHGYGIAE